MATNESKRVQKQRRENFDRVSVLIEKGGKHLLRVLALREGVSIAEMIRRAVLARGGLRMLPYPAELAKLETVTTKEEARRAVYRLQSNEESVEIVRHVLAGLADEPEHAEYITTMDHADIASFRDAVRRIEAAIQAEKPEESVFAPPIEVKLYGREIGIMRRMLANIERIDNATPQAEDGDING
jgi:hypothetical protein